MKSIIESLREIPVINRGEYEYLIHPITDGIPLVKPSYLRDVVVEICRIASLNEANKIVTIEAMGLPIAAALSLVTDLPFVVVRKKSYGLEGEVEVMQKTGYSEGTLYINCIDKNDKVVIVDDIISTGGTLISVIKGIEKAGAKILDIVCVFERGEGKERVKKDTGYDVKTLIKLDVKDGKVRILETCR